MLYDPKWEQPSLAGFVAWLETMPASKAYDWYGPCCAVDQYLISIGKPWEKDNTTITLMNHLAHPGWSGVEPTFGKLLGLARAAWSRHLANC